MDWFTFIGGIIIGFFIGKLLKFRDYNQSITEW